MLEASRLIDPATRQPDTGCGSDAGCPLLVRSATSGYLCRRVEDSLHHVYSGSCWLAVGQARKQPISVPGRAESTGGTTYRVASPRVLWAALRSRLKSGAALAGMAASPRQNGCTGFLVVGGFVAAQHLAKLNTSNWGSFSAEISRRYRRIAGPYLVVLIMAVAANALADLWLYRRSISAPATLDQFLAHTVFAQDVLGYEALPAGVWYLSIAFQLFAPTLALATLIAKLPQFAKPANGASQSRRCVRCSGSTGSPHQMSGRSIFWACCCTGSSAVRWLADCSRYIFCSSGSR